MNKIIRYQNWTAELNGKELTITYDGKVRVYDIKEKITDIEQSEEHPQYFTIKTNKGIYYQFKFEDSGFFVGDIYQSGTDTHLSDYAMFSFDDDYTEDAEEEEQNSLDEEND